MCYYLNSQLGGTSEPLSVDTLHDLFFLHERGTHAGVQAIWLSWGSSLAPVICGFLIEKKGWRWYHWLTTIMAGANMILIFFLVPETQYRRDLHEALDSVGADEEDMDQSPAEMSQSEEMKPEAQHKNAERVVSRSVPLPKRSFAQELKPWSPVQKDVNLLGSFVRPWATWCYPSVVWSVMSFSIHVCGYVFLLDLPLPDLY